jgi:hypothetical protein
MLRVRNVDRALLVRDRASGSSDARAAGRGDDPMTTRRTRARSMLHALAALPMFTAIAVILDHARRW